MNVPFKIDESSLPPGWGVAQINQIAEIVRGVTYKKADAKEVSAIGLLPILRATNIQDSTLVLDRDLVFVSAELVSESQVLRLGDIVVATSSGSKHLVGKTAQVKSEWEGSFGAFCAVIRPNNEIEPRYLGYFFESPAYKSYISAKAMGVNINNLRRGDLEEITVPIAPIEQQKRIVVEIEKQFSRLDEAVANLKRVKSNLKRYKAAVLKAAVEGKLTEEWRKQHPDVEPANSLLERILTERREKWTGKGKYKEPVAPDTSNLPELPEGWVWARLRSLPVDVFDGPFGSNLKSSDYVSSGVRVIRLENIGTREFIDEKESFVTEEKYEQLKKHEVRHGDIIFSSFVADEIRVVMLPDHIETAINKADCFCVRVTGAAINKRYLETFLATRTAYEQLVREVHGATRPRINTTQLKDCQIPIPPVDEQAEIVSKLSAMMSVVEVAETEVERNQLRANRLRQSILKQAFSGQLVSQDSSDEPASVLLERIRLQQALPVKAAREYPSPRLRVKPAVNPEPKADMPDHTSLDSVIDAILRLMQPGKEYSRADIADPLGLTSGRWNAAIQELKRRGNVRQVGERRGAKYLLGESK